MNLTRKHKRKWFVFVSLVVFVVFVPQFVSPAPMLSDFDIWGDSKGKEYDDNDVLGVGNVAHHSNGSELQKYARVLNFFPVPFEEECLANDGRRKGVCMNTYECRIQSGTSHGPCALGFGVCCVFTATCGTEVLNNLTYFVNPDFPDLTTGMKSCTVVVQKIDPDIVQLRLDFIHFNLGQPNRRTGVCDDDVFIMSGGMSKDLKLCGLNSGQHTYFDVDNANDSVTISMTLGDKVLSRLWEVRVTQVPFSQRAPPGCLQYHTGPSGYIQTMNFAENGRHLADQEYNVCMRQEEGMCSIAYEPCHENAFKIGPGNSNAIAPDPPSEGPPEQPEPVSPVEEADVGSGDGGGTGRMMNDCSDRILMPCDSEDLIMPGDSGPGFCELAHCGSSFCPFGETPCRIESSVTPFTIGVQFGAAAREESPEDNLGMCLKYEQLPCVA